MKIKNLKLSKVIVGAISLLSLGTFVSAATFLPKAITDLLSLLGPGGICSSEYISSRVQFVLVIALGGIVLVAVVYAMIAAFKYVSSQGEAGKMEDAQKSIKAIFIGIAAMIIAIVGIILVFAVFGAKPSEPSLYQTCVNAPTGKACQVCKDAGYSATNACGKCEDAIKTLCNSATDYTSYTSWEEIKGNNIIGTNCD
jgi:hypothetical protein